MAIEVTHLEHIYMPGTPFEKKALDDVSFSIKDGEFVGLIGHTGSGKSTLVMHLNGLLKPTSGSIVVDGLNLSDKDVDLREVRKRVGLVFQYPEYQLFEESVVKDVMFGPLNLALPEEGGAEAVLDALCQEGLAYFQFDEECPEVALSMPKTDVTAEAELKGVLQALGVTDAFADDADFSGISLETQLNIGSVLQKARLILDEDGTQAAAVTAVMVDTCAAPVEEPQPVEFRMDRPFVFVIADEATGAVCFAGFVANPIGN